MCMYIPYGLLDANIPHIGMSIFISLTRPEPIEIESEESKCLLMYYEARH